MSLSFAWKGTIAKKAPVTAIGPDLALGKWACYFAQTSEAVKSVRCLLKEALAFLCRQGYGATSLRPRQCLFYSGHLEKDAP